MVGGKVLQTPRGSRRGFDFMLHVVVCFEYLRTAKHCFMMTRGIRIEFLGCC